MKKIVLIAGLGHSGSTLLELLLGSQNDKLFGIGEVYNLIIDDKYLEKSEEILCSCGQNMQKCGFWGKFYEKLMNKNLSLSEKYDIVIENFNDYFGKDSVIIDSSKNISSLKFLSRKDDIELKAIFLIRDVRAYSMSYWTKFSQKKYGIKNTITNYIRKNVVLNFYKWYLANKYIIQYLTKNKIDFIKISYEELCFYPEVTLKEISRFLGTDINTPTLSMISSKTHSVLGNRMRTNENKKSQIRYDTRWLYQSNWIVPYSLFANIRRFNSRQVFAKIMDYNNYK